jgi:transcriptional regulator with XRE-family HTH domain
MRKDPLKAFGERVRTMREQSGLSQEALAARVGIHRTYLGGVERGERNICLLNILRLAAALGAQPRDLFDETGRR